MAKKIIVAGAIIAAALVAFAFAIVSSCSAGRSDGSRPLFEVLREAGYQGADEAWVDSLTDEQMAAIDIAYEHDVASGYQGLKEEWIPDKLTAHYDNSGGIVVMMPDGGEFTITVDGLGQAGASGGIDESGRSGEEDSANEAEPDVSRGSGDNGSLSGRAQSDAQPSDGSQPGRPSSGDSPSDASGSSDASSDSSTKVDVAGAIVSVDSVQAHSGDANVAVAVRIEHNPGILGTTLSVSYDESALTLKSAESGEAFKDVLFLTRSRTFETGCLFTWDGVDLAPADVKDGTILTLYFDIAPGAAPGVYPVAVREAGSTVDANLDEVGISVQDGNVVVE